MVNVVNAVCMAAIALAAQCLSIGAAIDSMLRRAVAFSMRRAASIWSASAEGLPLVG